MYLFHCIAEHYSLWSFLIVRRLRNRPMILTFLTFTIPAFLIFLAELAREFVGDIHDLLMLLAVVVVSAIVSIVFVIWMRLVDLPAARPRRAARTAGWEIWPRQDGWMLENLWWVAAGALAAMAFYVPMIWLIVD